MTKLSVVINTLNEEKNIERCLRSVKKIADEIVVVDMESDDETVKIAQKFGAKVFNHERTGYVEPARNFAISKATGKWILILDADEEVSAGLTKKIKELINKPEADYYRIPRKNIIFGKWIKHTGWWPDYNIRFFKNGSVVWNEIIHSVPTTVGDGADLEASIENSIIHHNYQRISQFIQRMDRYSDKQARVLINKNYKFKWDDLINKPLAEFVSRFFAAQGYKDGIHGLALSALQAVSELIVYLKIWENEKFKQENLKIIAINKEAVKAQKVLNYWKADALVTESGGVVAKIKRKFKLQ